MKCPKCFDPDSTVLETRSDDGYIIRRRRKCDGCGHKFTTHELGPGAYTHVRSHLKVWKARQQGAYMARRRRLANLARRMRELRERGMTQREIHRLIGEPNGLTFGAVQWHTRTPRSQP